MLTPNYEQAIRSPPRLRTRMINGHPKTPSLGGVSLLHDSYNCKKFTIWKSLMFTLISPGYTSILSHPKITPYFPYTTLHYSTIKRSLPHYENVRFNSHIQALIVLLFHCLACFSLGLISTLEGLSLQTVTFIHLRRSPKLLSRSGTKMKEQFWLLAPVFYHNSPSLCCFGGWCYGFSWRF